MRNSTAAAVKAATPKGLASPAGTGYPLLTRWPTLTPAVAVHTNLGGNHLPLRVPVKLMRLAGMAPEKGVHAALYKGRLLLWAEGKSGPFGLTDSQFTLSKRGLTHKLTLQNFTIVQGPDYLVIATQTESMRLAGSFTPVISHTQWERVGRHLAVQVDAPLAVDALDGLIAWKDFGISQSNPKRPSPVANVSGTIWWQAGFSPGDSVRFTRYQDATVVEKCDPADAHSTLTASHGLPRHYIGPSLFDVHNASAVRTVALRDRIILTSPESAPGARCNGLSPSFTSKQGSWSALAAKPTPAPAPAPVRLARLAPEAIEVVAWSEHSMSGRNILSLTGHIWRYAGFEIHSPVRQQRFENGVLFEPCAEPDMDWCLSGTPDNPYNRSFTLHRYGLSRTGKIRVIATKQGLLVTNASSDLARKCTARTNLSVVADRERHTPVQRELRRATSSSAAAGLPSLDLSSLTRQKLAWRLIGVSPDGQVRISRTLWWFGGFAAGDPIRLVRHGDALVVEKVEAGAEDMLLGSPGVDFPHHVFSAEDTGLGRPARLKVAVLPGKLILMADASMKKTSAGDSRAAPRIVQTPTRQRRFEALARLQAPAVTPVVPVAAVAAPVQPSVVGKYPVPAEGKRLQLQGRWLAEHGFVPGTHYTTRVQDGAVHVTLAADGARTVTKHSEGRSKLYVPPEGLAALGCSTVRVEALAGELRLLAA